MATTSNYDIEKIRKKMSARIEGRRADPTEFRPAKVGKDEIVKYRFFILPELSKGDQVSTGVASRDMEMFVLKNGQHWFNNRPTACPRLYNDEECEICQAGFDAMNEIPKGDKEKRQAIAKDWLSSANFATNIYFPNIESNPEELRGKVMWYNSPKQVFDMWYAAIARDDAGDSDDPEAYGVVYDPYNAFMFQLTVKGGGSYNDYKSSKFIASVGAVPIACDSNKKADEKAIKRILGSRHDLYLKIEVPNPQAIRQLYQRMVHGTDIPENEIKATTHDDDVQVSKGRDLPIPPVSSGIDEEVPVTKATKPKTKTKATNDTVRESVAKEPVAKSPPVVDSDNDDDDDNDNIRSILAKLNESSEDIEE